MPMLGNQIPTPPVDMVMPPANTIIAIICYVLLAAFAAWTLFEARRTRSPIPILILIGGLFTALQEPILGHVGSFWYPEIGPAPVLRAFNVSIPLWAVAVYGLYVGGLSVLVYRKLKSGLTPRQLWAACFLIWAFNLGLELPGLNLGIYRYYGDPTFNVFGFPLCWAMTNATIPMFVAAVLIAYQDILTGARTLLILPMMPMMGIAAEAATGFPMWLSMNSGSGASTKLLAGLATLGLSLLLTYLISLKFCQPAHYQMR
jgi:hypothetical protein